VHVTEVGRRSSPTSKTGRAPLFPPVKWHDGRSRETGANPCFAAPYSRTIAVRLSCPLPHTRAGGHGSLPHFGEDTGRFFRVSAASQGKPISAKRPPPWKVIPCPSPSTSKISSGPRAASLVLVYREKYAPAPWTSTMQDRYAGAGTAGGAVDTLTQAHHSHRVGRGGRLKASRERVR
jgi:hypothetical protein